MFKYVDKNTLTVVDSPVRFDLRMKEYRHLKIYIPEGPWQPKEATKGFKMRYTMHDIATAWGVCYKTVSRNRQKYLPFPDGRWNGCLVWRKIPENPYRKPQIFEI